jgi:hypothetical protein
MRYIIGQRPTARSVNPTQNNPARRRPKTIWPFDVVKTIDPFASQQCYMGTNGQIVCPGATNLRARGRGTSAARHHISTTKFFLPNGGGCWLGSDGQWHCMIGPLG